MSKFVPGHVLSILLSSVSVVRAINSLGNHTSDTTDTMGTHTNQLWDTTEPMCRTCVVASTSKLDLCQRFYRASAAKFKRGATLACARHVLSLASLVFAAF